MTKRIAAFAVCVIMMLSIALTGCGGNNAPEDTQVVPAETTEGIGSTEGAETTYTRCLNAGDITVTSPNALRFSAGGISPWSGKNEIIYGATFIDCVNIGAVSGKSDVIDGLNPLNSDKMKFTNCYTVADSSHFNKNYNQMFNTTNPVVPTEEQDKYYITVPETVAAYISTAKAEQTNNAAELITKILEAADYDTAYAHDKDDGMFLSSLD